MKLTLNRIASTLFATIISTSLINLTHQLSAAAVGLGISPSGMTIKIDPSKSTTHTLRVINIESAPVKIKLTVHNWDTDPKNQLQLIPSSEQSLDRWMIINPSEFTIPGNKSQTIRFSIRPRVQPQPGEYRALITVEGTSLADPKIPVQDNVAGSQIAAVGQLSIAVYGHVGEAQKTGVLNSVVVNPKPKQTTVNFDISSQGNSHIKLIGQYAVYPEAKYPGDNAIPTIDNIGQPNVKLPANVSTAGLLPSSPVLPNTRRTIGLEINQDLPPGKYVFTVNGKLGEKNVKQGIPFTIQAGNTSNK
jgi:hypothetical protein